MTPPENFTYASGGPPRFVGPKISYVELDNLVGRLLTINDAAANDPVQRAANKSLLRQACYDWLNAQADDQRVENWT